MRWTWLGHYCSPFISYENFNARVKGCLYHIDALKLSEENYFGQSFLKLILKSQIWLMNFQIDAIELRVFSYKKKYFQRFPWFESCGLPRSWRKQPSSKGTLSKEYSLTSSKIWSEWIMGCYIVLSCWRVFQKCYTVAENSVFF